MAVFLRAKQTLKTWNFPNFNAVNCWKNCATVKADYIRNGEETVNLKNDNFNSKSINSKTSERQKLKIFIDNRNSTKLEKFWKVPLRKYQQTPANGNYKELLSYTFFRLWYFYEKKANNNAVLIIDTTIKNTKTLKESRSLGSEKEMQPIIPTPQVSHKWRQNFFSFQLNAIKRLLPQNTKTMTQKNKEI